MEMLIGNLPQIITAIFAIGFIWKYGKKALNLVKETQELLVAIVIAFADKKLTQEELDTIIKEAKDIPQAIKDMLKKDG